MALLVDSYSESNQDATDNIGGGVNSGGQSVTPNASGKLQSIKWYIKKFGSPTGNAVAKIYAHTGTYGTSSLPTGAALATSDNFDVSTLTTSFQLIEFIFSGANKIDLTNGTRYCITLEFAQDASNYLVIGLDSSSPGHGGNYFEAPSTPFSGLDANFYLYEEASSPSASVSPSSSASASHSPSASGSPSVSPSSSISASISPSSSSSPSLSPSGSPSATGSPSSSISPSASLSPSGSESASTSPSSSASASFSPSASPSATPSASSSISASVSRSASPSASHSPSSSRSLSTSPSFSPSPSLSPSLHTYSKQAIAALPAGKDTLSTLYTTQQEQDVFASDDIRVSLSGTATDYLIHQFKKVNDNNTDLLNIKIELQVTLPPTTAPVYMQIWNVSTSAWQTLYVANVQDSEEDIDLHDRITENLSNYYDGNNEIAVRVYQQITAGTKLMDVDLVEILFIRAYDDLYTDRDTSYISKYRPRS